VAAIVSFWALAAIAFAVVDERQSPSLGAHLASIGRGAALKVFTAEIFPGAIAMFKYVSKMRLWP
jgi:hypothetical protein